MKSLLGKEGVILIGLIIFGCPEVFAFDVDGFKSGMTKEEAKETLKRWNFDRVDEEEDLISAYDTSETGQRHIVLGFKNDKLNSFQKHFSPSMENFRLLLNKLTSVYGRPSESDSETSLNTNETRKTTVRWKRRFEIIELCYIPIPDNKALYTIVYIVSETIKSK